MNKTTLTTIIIGLVALVVVVVILAKLNAGNRTTTSSDATQSQNQSQAQSDQQTTDAQVNIEDLTVGEGAQVKEGDTVSVDYTGTFTNGTQFDTSVGKQPFEFTVGQGQVIKGWDQGLIGMKVGGKRKLTVPPELGYGMSDYGNIPGGSTLIFDIELHSIK